MTTPNNPFFPGFGQTGDTAANPLMAGLDMMREAWAGLAGAGGLNGLTQTVPMNLEELDRRIAELRTVENWLKLNQSMLASSIQALEVQRATIATLKSFAGNASAMTNDPASTNTDAAQQWWNLMREQFNQLTQAAATSMQTTAGATQTAASPVAKKSARRSNKQTPKRAPTR